jgi:hypothetical protein
MSEVHKVLMIGNWLVEITKPTVIPAFPMARPREHRKEASYSLYEARDRVGQLR